jgi:KUP system potassium uptake protein
VILHVETQRVPHVDVSAQARVEDLDYVGDDIHYLTLQYGFQDRTDVPTALARVAQSGELGELDIAHAIYLVSAITLIRGDDPGLAAWRKRLFLLLSKTAASPVRAFHLPEHRIVTMGSYIEL